MFSIIFCDPWNFKMRSKIGHREYNSGCFDVFPVNLALSVIWSDWKTKGTLRGKKSKISAGRCNFSFQQHTNIIQRLPHIFDHGQADYDD